MLPPGRLSYLLRLWRVQVDGRITWHGCLVGIPGGAEHGFANLASLFEYLENECGRLNQGLDIASPTQRNDVNQPE